MASQIAQKTICDAMASVSSHARSHSLLLLQKILNLRDAASPLTLVLDTLEQTARPLLRELYTRAKVQRPRAMKDGGCGPRS